MSRALNSLASIYEERGELEREGQYLERALALAQRMGDPVRVVFLTFRRGWHAYTMGSWDQARTHLEAAASLDRRIGTSWASAYPSLGLGALELSQGNSQGALRHLQLCLCVAERNNDLRALVGAQTLLAERDLLEGQVVAAEERVEQILSHPRVEEQELARTLTVQARVYLEKGDDARAEVALTAGIERAAAEENSLALVDLLTLKGRLAARQQSWSEAEPVLDRALSLAQSLRNPYAEARVLYERGVLHTLAGQPRRAHEHLERALAIFERLGARPYIHRAKQALAETAKTHGAR